jgi:pyruvate dehydrogenase E2 component (dihydrolipoamide acetyltransferase)
MVREFNLPDVGEGVAEGEIVEWLVEVGDTVSEDQPVAEVETDKAVVEVPSPVNGTVTERRYEEGDIVNVGDVFIVFDVEGEEPGAEAEAEAADAEAADAGAATDDGETGATASDAGGTADDDGGEAGAAVAAGEEDDGEQRVFASPSARRVARELGVDITTVEGSGPAGRISEDDVRAAAESGGDDGGAATGGDAAEASAAAGTDAGDGTTAADDGAEPATTGASAGGAGGPEAAGRDSTLAAPATRRVAEELGVDINDVPATDERDGQPFVTESAVREYAESQQAAQAADAAAVAEGGAGDASAAGEARSGAAARPAAGEDERIPYRGVRRTIGKQMERSKFTAPHVTHHDQVDVTALVESRQELKERASERGINLSYMPFVLKAIVAALKEYPILNSQLDEDEEEIVKRGEYNIGVATATDAGLMVPVVEAVDHKSLLQIASEMNELVAKARDRSIAREEMQGGTFTITNFGAIGGEYATPIINYPETAILGLGAIKERPWVVDGEVVPRHVLTLSLSIDHRVIDGAEAAQFTNTLKEYLQNPTLLLLE